METAQVCILLKSMTQGSITGFDIVQSGGAAFDKEVIRMLKKMPTWKPAFRNGQPTAVPFTQPVTFMAMD